MFFWLIIWAELICSPMGKQVQQPPGELGSGTSINPNTLWPNTARLTWRPKLCHTSKGWINFWFRNPMQQENLLLWIGKHLSVLWIPFLIPPSAIQIYKFRKRRQKLWLPQWCQRSQICQSPRLLSKTDTQDIAESTKNTGRHLSPSQRDYFSTLPPSIWIWGRKNLRKLIAWKKYVLNIHVRSC